jgi:hypothetical protein
MGATTMTYLKTGSVVALFGIAALVSCTQDTPEIVLDTPTKTESRDVDAFATSLLNSLQPRSITASVEYCGYIYETANGGLAATSIIRGAEDFCDLPETTDATVASFHTHGGFSDAYDNEVPSVEDMAGDLDAGIDGYISTPAGRVWLIDHENEIALQLCNALCVIADPNDDPSAAGFVPQTFTLRELEARFE